MHLAGLTALECVYYIEYDWHHFPASIECCYSPADPDLGPNCESQNCVTCETGDCDDNHPMNGSCRTDHDQCLEISFLDALVTAWEDADSNTLRRFMASKPDQVLLNKERRALQVRGCGNSVIAHLPLTTEIVAEID